MKNYTHTATMKNMYVPLRNVYEDLLNTYRRVQNLVVTMMQCTGTAIATRTVYAGNDTAGRNFRMKARHQRGNKATYTCAHGCAPWRMGTPVVTFSNCFFVTGISAFVAVTFWGCFCLVQVQPYTDTRAACAPKRAFLTPLWPVHHCTAYNY